MCLQSLYYENIVETIKKHFKGSVQKDLLNILYTSIELKNISKIYRYKQYFHESEDSIRSSLFLQYSRLPKDMMNRLISASGPKEVFLYYQLLNITSIWMIKNLPISNIMQIVFNIISQKDTCVFQIVHHLFI